jgi:hypothetical protein
MRPITREIKAKLDRLKCGRNPVIHDSEAEKSIWFLLILGSPNLHNDRISLHIGHALSLLNEASLESGTQEILKFVKMEC